MKTNAKMCFANTFSHSWVTDKYIALGSYSIGDVVDVSTEVTSSEWEYAKFSVKAGDTVQLRTIGGQSPRAYAILDINKRLLEVASASQMASTTLTITNDGWLVVDNDLNTVPSPTLVHKGVREPSAIYLNGYAKRVHLGADKVWIRKDEPMYIGANQVMTWSAVGAGYIDLNKTIGTVISFTPQTSATQQYSIISVKKGDVFLLTCAGGTYGKPWGLLDDSRKLLSYCTTAGVTNSPLTASADGFLVVNNIADTQPSPICKRVNPHKYDTVKIGNQVWMASNLDENLGLLQSNQWYYNNDKATYGKYGKLYTWTNLNDNLSAILPSGWRWPTKSDFETLGTTIGGTSAEVSSKVRNDSWGWDTLGSDTENFGAVAGGRWSSEASFDRMNGQFLAWSSSWNGSTTAWNLQLSVGGYNTADNSPVNTRGFACRLVKNDAVYFLPTTTFDGTSSGVITTSHILLNKTGESGSLDNWTLFGNVTANSCNGTFSFLMNVGGYDGTNNVALSSGFSSTLSLKRSVFKSGAVHEAISSTETGKFALRRSTSQEYIQYSLDGKTWANTSIKVADLTVKTDRPLTFGGYAYATSQFGKGSISAKLWDSAKDDIRELFE